MSSLAPCPSCQRHIRVAERACPFCKSALAHSLTPIPGTQQRLKRAAAFAFTASLGLAGCNTDNGNVTPVYGAPADTGVDVAADRPTSDSPVVTDVPLDVTPDASPMRDASSDDGGFLAMYGGPPPTDSGTDAAAADAAADGPQDDGSSMALYGLPPPDGAVTDTGGGGLRYGAPPPMDV